MLDCNHNCFKSVATPSISCCIYLSELEIAYCLCYGLKHEIYSWNGAYISFLVQLLPLHGWIFIPWLDWGHVNCFY